MTTTIENLNAALTRLTALTESVKTIVGSQASTSNTTTAQVEAATLAVHNKLNELETFLADYKPVVANTVPGLVSRLETDFREVVNTVETDVEKLFGHGNTLPNPISANTVSAVVSKVVTNTPGVVSTIETDVKEVANTVETDVKKVL